MHSHTTRAESSHHNYYTTESASAADKGHTSKQGPPSIQRDAADREALVQAESHTVLLPYLRGTHHSRHLIEWCTGCTADVKRKD